MISIQEATEIVLNHSRPFGEEEVPLTEAVGRILRQEIAADRDFPPFDRVTMDGIAIRYRSFAEGQRAFPIEGMQAAGSPQNSLQSPAACFEVMTGAILPQQADTVIRYEDLHIENGQAKLLIEAIREGQNVHRRGTDRQQGVPIVRPGALISPAEIGVAATVGLSRLRVAQLPKAVIISTGEELVGIDDQPAPHQIRSSNVSTIRAALSRWGIRADMLHIADDMEATQDALEGCLEKYELIILSGGVSKGKFDYVPGALDALGVEKRFHRVSQRPGKPFWFGEAPNGTIVFALPGNPVSAFMCCMRYVRPWLRKCLGLEPMGYAYAVLSEDFRFVPDLTYFLQVRTAHDPHSSRLMASPVEGKGSGDLANLADADAFLELPRGRELFEKGEVFPLIFYRR